MNQGDRRNALIEQMANLGGVGVAREFEVKAAIRRRQANYIGIDYRVVSRKPRSL